MYQGGIYKHQKGVASKEIETSFLLPARGTFNFQNILKADKPLDGREKQGKFQQVKPSFETSTIGTNSVLTMNRR